MNCQKCHKPLTDPASIARGLGPDCAESAAAAITSGLERIGTTEAELAGMPEKRQRLILMALARGNERDARLFLAVGRGQLIVFTEADRTEAA